MWVICIIAFLSAVAVFDFVFKLLPMAMNFFVFFAQLIFSFTCALIDFGVTLVVVALSIEVIAAFISKHRKKEVKKTRI